MPSRSFLNQGIAIAGPFLFGKEKLNMEKLQITYKALTEIKEYRNNPRKNEEAIEPVMESIKNFGFVVPILIDQNNIILAGHTRKKAAEILKLKEVPCIYVEDLTQEQQKAFRLVDNKTAEFSQWDMEKLEQELSSIFNIDMETFHFPDFSEEELGITDEDFLQESEISQSKKEKTVICPHCGKEFTV